MGIKRIKTRSQRITSSGYLKKNQNQRTVAGFSYFKKTSQNCRVSWKPGKEEPGRFLGGYFTFTIWDLSFKTSTDILTEEIVRCFTGLSLPPPPPKPPSHTNLLNLYIWCEVSKYYGQSIAHIPLCFPPIMWDWPEENVKLAKEIVSSSLPFAPFHSMLLMFQKAHNMPSDMLHSLNTHNGSKTCITWTRNVIRYLSI